MKKLILLCCSFALFLSATASAKDKRTAETDRFYSGNDLYNRKLYAVAIIEYNAFLSQHGNHAKAEEARLGIALSYYCMGKYREAEPYLRNLIQNGKAGDRHQLCVLRGQCLLKLNNPAEAEKSFVNVANSRSEDKFKAVAFAGLAEAQFKQQKWAEVITSTDKLMKANPEPQYAKRDLYQGAYACHQLKRFKQAIPMLEKLSGMMKGDPLEHETVFFLAECYRETEKPAEAAEQYSKAVVGFKEPAVASEIYYRLGFVNFVQKKYDDAIAAFDKSLKKEREGKFSHTPYTFPKLCEVCEMLARKVVAAEGGRIEQNDKGEEVFVIPIQAPKPGKIEQCWEPGPIAGSKFTEAEMAQIKSSPARH